MIKLSKFLLYYWKLSLALPTESSVFTSPCVIYCYLLVVNSILGGFKITADGDGSHEIKRCLLLRRLMTNLDSVLKSRDITLLTKVRIVKAMVFLISMYEYESWTIKKASNYLSVCLNIIFPKLVSVILNGIN